VTDPQILTAGMIAEARSAGLTWAQIGSVLSGGTERNPKLAKKRAKAIAREANRKAAALLGEEAADG
jgi:hypothetical protein